MYYQKTDNIKFINKEYKTIGAKKKHIIFAGGYSMHERWMLENILKDIGCNSYLVELNSEIFVCKK